MEFAEQLRASLQQFLAAGAIEIRESTGRVTSATPLSWELRGAASKPLLHLWSENCNVTRRVLAITAQSDDRLALAVERFGRTKPDRLEIVRLDHTPSSRILTREEFCDQLRRILAEQFPDETVEKISIAADLEHSLSRVYARGISHRAATQIAFLAVADNESPGAVDSCLTYALLWLDRARQTAGHGSLSALRLILPKGKSAAIANRLAALDPRPIIQVFELDPLRETLERINPAASGNVTTWLVPRCEAQLLAERAQSDLAPIVALAPREIALHPSVQNEEVVLRFLGLPFARWHNGQIFFGVDAKMKELSAATRGELQRLVHKLQIDRSPLALDVRRPLYRAQAERWMQSLVMQDLSRIDLTLDPQHLYEQVLALAAGQHGILDLLCINRARRLVILELKAGENLDLPLQAADYWSRIRRHQALGDFARYGYFPGIELQPAPPLVYLIAPALRFHPTTDALQRYLSPELEIIRVGLAESWRRGIRVMFRQ